MVALLKELGLEINKSKTAILHYEGKDMDVIEKVAEAIGLQADPNGKFDGITTAGLTFGGYPVGSDDLMNIFSGSLSQKVKSSLRELTQS